MWQGQEGCEVIASVITVAVCNLALIYLISSLSFKGCLVIACVIQLVSSGLPFKNNEAVETERKKSEHSCSQCKVFKK